MYLLYDGRNCRLPQKLRILIAEDDGVSLVVMGNALKDHEVTMAADGDQALKHLTAGEFDLLITDIMMPHTNGIGIIREVRKAHPRMKIIAVSSGSNMGPRDLLEWAKTAGADDSLEKPFYDEQLREKVSQVMASG